MVAAPRLFPKGAWRVAFATLATIGALCVAGALLLAGLAPVMFEAQVVRNLYSPDNQAVAEVEVTKGGLGTVWTTRVHLRAVRQARPWTIYQTKDSDFEPTLEWKDRSTLIVGLPCDRFDHVSNPDDWARSNPSEARLKVRFDYPDECA